jgi:hypothetical protein
VFFKLKSRTLSTLHLGLLFLPQTRAVTGGEERGKRGSGQREEVERGGEEDMTVWFHDCVVVLPT